MPSASPLLQSVKSNAETIDLMQKAVAAELRRSQSIAAKTESFKVQFLAGISHELRTPLNAIIGFSDMLLGGHAGPLATARHAEYLGLIQASAQHLQHLIDTMLDTVRLELGKASLNIEEIEVAALCQQCIDITRSDQSLGDCPIDLEGGAAVRFRQDPDRLRQILLNLLRNAIQHTPAGGRVEMQIVAKPDDPNGHALGGHPRSVRVSVIDHGSGIPPEKLAELFKPFCQLEDALTRSTGGLGLGLSICRSLADLMGGEIGCRSQPGERTEFWVDLPDRSMT